MFFNLRSYAFIFVMFYKQGHIDDLSLLYYNYGMVLIPVIVLIWVLLVILSNQEVRDKAVSLIMASILAPVAVVLGVVCFLAVFAVFGLMVRDLVTLFLSTY